MTAVIEFDPTCPSGEGLIPGATRRKARRKEHVVSETSRALILEELGIDPRAAQEAYWYDREAQLTRKDRREAAAKAAAEAELLRRAEAQAEQREVAHQAAVSTPIIETEDVTDTVRTLIFAAFLLFGLAGFLHTFLSPPAWVMWGLPGLVAVTTTIYLLINREEEIPLPLLATFLKP